MVSKFSFIMSDIISLSLEDELYSSDKETSPLINQAILNSSFFMAFISLSYLPRSFMICSLVDDKSLRRKNLSNQMIEEFHIRVYTLHSDTSLLLVLSWQPLLLS